MSRQDLPSVPAPNIDNNLYRDKPKVHHGSLYQWIKRILSIKPVKKIRHHTWYIIEYCKFCGDYLAYSPQICGE